MANAKYDISGIPTALGVDTAGTLHPLLTDTGGTLLVTATGGSVESAPTVFKTATATTTGNTVVWTPAAGKKFRLLGYSIQITNGSTGAAASTEVTFQDAAVAVGQGSSFYTPTTVASAVGAGSSTTGWITLENGYLSSTINNALNVNLSQTLTNGEVRVNVIGSEE